MWSTTLLVAVAAAVCAAPPGPAQPGPLQTIETLTTTVAAGAPNAQTPPPSATLTTAPPSNNETTTTTASPSDNEMTPAPVPVYLRHPQAVLFGLTCGGTIISPTWVLTAAHCTLFSRGRTVLAGTDNSEDGSGVSVRVKRLIVHPRFSVGPYWLNPKTYNIKQVAARFDFMLVELASPLPLDGVRIAAARVDSTHVPDGVDVSYAGYGAEHHGETMRHQMHEMELTTVSDKTCAAKLEQFDPQDMFCAKGRPPRFDSACNGDSGSGLVSEGRLLGVTSWVEEDSLRCFPGAIVVFSRVSQVRDWIRNITAV